MKPEVSIIRDNDEEKYKQALADAVYHAINLLKEEGVISENVSNVISSASKEIGREISKRVKDIAEDIELVEDEEVMHHLDSDLEDDFEEVPEESYEEKDDTRSTISSEGGEIDEDRNTSKENRKTFQYGRIPWEIRVKAVKLAKLHPKWSLDTLRSRTTRFLTSRKQLRLWKLDVERNGASSIEKQNIIDDWTYKRFVGARSRKRQVTTRMLQQWATERAQELNSHSFKFKASRNWVDKFKRDRNIRQRRIIRFINKADPPMLEVMLP